jgi:alkylated DNA nucleotide flippase Atl1
MLVCHISIIRLIIFQFQELWQTRISSRSYAVAREIPYGKVTSYGAIAKALGTPVQQEWSVGQ